MNDNQKKRPKEQKYIVKDRFKEVCKDFKKNNYGKGYKDFCLETGIGYSSFKRVMNKNADLSAENLYRIAWNTGVSIDWLLGLTNKKYISEEN